MLRDLDESQEERESPGHPSAGVYLRLLLFGQQQGSAGKLSALLKRGLEMPQGRLRAEHPGAQRDRELPPRLFVS